MGMTTLAHLGARGGLALRERFEGVKERLSQEKKIHLNFDAVHTVIGWK